MKTKKNSTLDFAITFYEGIVKKKPDYVDAMTNLAEAYTRKGLFEKGLELDQRLAGLCKEDSTVYYNLACSYALVGQPQEAIQTLRTAIQLGYNDFAYMKKDPDLKSLHEDPAFLKLTSRPTGSIK